MPRIAISGANRAAATCYGFLAGATAPVRFASTSATPAPLKTTKPRAPRTPKAPSLAASSPATPTIVAAADIPQSSPTVSTTRKRATGKTAAEEEGAAVASAAPVKATRGRKKKEVEPADGDGIPAPAPVKRTRSSASKTAASVAAKTPTTRKRSAATLAKIAATEEAEEEATDTATATAATELETLAPSPSPHLTPAFTPSVTAPNSDPTLARTTAAPAAAATKASTSARKTTVRTTEVKKKPAVTAPTTAPTLAHEAIPSVSSRFASAKSTNASTKASVSPPTPQEKADAAASQEEALAELKRLRLAAAPPSIPQPGPGLAASNPGRAHPTVDPNTRASTSRGADATDMPNIVDTPEYKKATRQWTSLIVAMPILLVTSYFLFDRLALGHMPTDLTKYREKLQDAVDQLGEAATNALGGESRSPDGARNDEESALKETPQ
ncbi:hypothetical protein SEPCBS119000_002075 [Sporothrix epigloea]|uniref:Uncharacterized protein n=1 Tax=Sporothrix epigloea TaxID=1892477 RepID=A0ABP0DE69_9PEZI